MIEISIRSHQAHDATSSYVIGIVKFLAVKGCCEEATSLEFNLCPCTFLEPLQRRLQEMSPFKPGTKKVSIRGCAWAFLVVLI